MINKKGFTLVEILATIVILSVLIIICVPLVSSVNRNIRMSILNTKIENIEKAAVLYGQKNKERFRTPFDKCDKYCKGISKCYCYGDENSSETIKVETLFDPNGDGNTKDSLIESDKVKEGKEVITNSLDEEKDLNGCEIQLYEKYGKIYAVYDKSINKSVCWVVEG